MSDVQQKQLRPLSAVEELFCVAYSNSFNGRQAYQDAVDNTTTDNSAASVASRMLQKPEIQARVAELIEERKQRLEVDGDLIIHELMTIGFASISEFIDEQGDISPELIKNASPQLRRAIAEVTNTYSDKGGAQRRIKMHDKIRALELVGKKLKLFTDKVEHSGDQSAPPIMNIIFRKPGEVKDEPSEFS